MEDTQYIKARVPPEIVRGWRLYLADTGKKSQDALAEVLVKFLSSRSDESAAPAPPPPRERRFAAKNSKAHELLEELLNDGTGQQVEWITGNLVTFVEAIRLRKKYESAPVKQAAGDR